MVAILAIICAVGLPIALGTIIVVQLLRNRHTERIEMIKQGAILAEPEKPEKKPNRYPALRNGLLMVGLALGIALGALMGPVFTVADSWVDLTVPTMALLLGGISFIIYFFLARLIQKKERVEDNL